MSDLAAAHAAYLGARQHTIRSKTPAEQARYVHGEALELVEAVDDLADRMPSARRSGKTAALAHARHEIADVVLAAVTLASMLGVTVEQCIAEKTEADRGRG